MFECRLLILNAHSVRCAHVADSLARLRCAPPSADLTPSPFPKGKGRKVKESRSIHCAHLADSPARFASSLTRARRLSEWLRALAARIVNYGSTMYDREPLPPSKVA